LATTTAKAFEEFGRIVALSDAQRETVTGRRSTAGGYLREAFPSSSTLPLNNAFLIGSAERATIVRPLDDVDILATFTNKDRIFEQYRSDSKRFLYRVRDALSTYQVKVVGARGQAVRLFYQNPPHVDIAPVFKWDGGGYALPAGDGSWLTTDPFVQAEWISGRNETLNSHLKPVVRLLKRWNRAHSSRLKSFHLEVMAATLFAQMNSNYRDALHVFFTHAENYLRVQDPAGYGGDLSGRLTAAQRSDVVTSFRSARDHAKKALDLEAAGRHREAIQQWRLVLGDEFPAYG
jgi:hypothetical protein